MSLLWNVGLWLFTFYIIWQSVRFMIDLRPLINIRNFYVHLLNIPEHDMQTVSWQDIVARIMALRDANPKTAQLTPAQRRWIGSQSKERLDAHDIANRLMRKDNYLIAMFNKDVLNLTIPFPFIRGRQLYSRTLEFYIQFSIIDFVFNEAGQVNQEFLKSSRRGQLSEKLRQRLLFAGVIHCFCFPFIIAYLIILFFFTYYNVCRPICDLVPTI
jgi:autophagy-related protein 9